MSESEVVGTYVLRDIFGTDTLILKQDGAFDETFISASGQTYRSSGKWHYEISDREPWVILDAAMVVSLGGREPPNRLTWRLKARRFDDGVVLSEAEDDPDRIVILRKQGP